MLNLPVSYVCLKLGAPAESTVIVAIVMSQICLFARLFLLKGMTGLSPGLFIRKVYLNVFAVAAVAVVVPLLAGPFYADGFAGFCISVVVCVASAGLSVLFVGCSAKERYELKELILRRKSR